VTAASWTVLVRADASLQIGTGHVMRCLTLADALRRRGARCTFVCRAHDGHLIGAIKQQGHSIETLPVGAAHAGAGTTSHAHWLGADWLTDAQQTIAALGSHRPDWIVVDHYALDAAWESALRSHAGRVLAIDDLADRPHDADLLVDQNLGRDAADYAGLVPAGCTVLAGATFALLRREFAQWRERSLQRRRSPSLRRLLITMGGIDLPNATGAVLQALRACELPPDCRLSVVMGAAAPWLDQVRSLAALMPRPTEVLVRVEDMAQQMAHSDLAIGAAGGTAWERCCLGLPVLLVLLADNQLHGARALEAAGAAMLIGDAAAVERELVPALARASAPAMLTRMAEAAAQLTDGLGADRVAQRMVDLDA
jgi:UDP-2,4-diacetamido-2,4,6-trideoxy-beta-L-altropyranose hydrolase